MEYFSCYFIDDSNEEDIQKDTTERDEVAGGKRKLLIILLVWVYLSWSQNCISMLRMFVE